VNPKPTVTLDGFPIAICTNQPPFKLAGGHPAGGIYSGVGVDTGYFHPSVAGQGNHLITYSYTDSLGCQNLASEEIPVSVCTKIEGVITSDMKAYVFPNPFSNSVTFQLEGINHVQCGELILYNSIGKEVMRRSFDNIVFKMDRGELGNGIYFYRFFVNDRMMGNGKVVVE
jgi:hypothetical protein